MATDVSVAAMTFATANANAHEVAGRVQLITGDAFEPLRRADIEPFDGIVSNPPYVREDELPGLQPEVAVHEPTEALVSGEDGLALTRRLIAEAPKLLKPGGWMILELDPAQCGTVAELFGAAGFFNTRVHKDLSGLDRIVAAALPKGG